MKLSKIFTPIAISLAIVSCGEPDVSGTYISDNQYILNVDKTKKDDSTYTIGGHIPYNHKGKILEVPYKKVVYKKNNSFYLINNDEVVATLNGDEITLSKFNVTYKKKNL